MTSDRDEGFLGRWARLKKRSAVPEAEPAPESVPAENAVQPAAPEEPFDPASLPALDTLDQASGMAEGEHARDALPRHGVHPLKIDVPTRVLAHEVCDLCAIHSSGLAVLEDRHAQKVHDLVVVQHDDCSGCSGVYPDPEAHLFLPLSQSSRQLASHHLRPTDTGSSQK